MLALIKTFDLESIEDQTRNIDPGFIMLIRKKSNKNHYIIVIYLSKLVSKFCYYVVNVGNDPAHFWYPNFKDKSPIAWNYTPIETEDSPLL